MIDFKQLAQQYKSELLDRVMPFWMEKSIDTEFGGYFTCLERDGEVFDTDKFIWLQGREVWMLATLYNKVEKRQEWLDAAIQGAEFLKRYGHDGNLNWYFALDREIMLVTPYCKLIDDRVCNLFYPYSHNSLVLIFITSHR